MAVAVGEITPDQIRSHPDRNVLTKVLGGNENLRPDVTVLEGKPGDVILLCSDGFWEYVTEDVMIGYLKYAFKPSKWLARMRTVRNRLTTGGSDNNTAVAVYLTNK